MICGVGASRQSGLVNQSGKEAVSGDPLLRAVDAVMFSVPDLDSGIAFYRDQLGHQLLWRNDQVGQAGLACAEPGTEIVLSTLLPSEPTWLVHDAVAASETIRAAGGTIVAPPREIPIGHVAVTQDPFGNRLVLVDLSGHYRTDDTGTVIGTTALP
jgi:predicted enzyme related to lactoylglutathione lyase